VKALARLPRWAHALLLAGNLLASLALLAANWAASYPNLVASWVQGSVLVTLVPPAVAWVDRTLAAHHASVESAVTTAVKTHVDRALAAPPPDGGESP
jgi:hypothetical protein